MKFEVKENYDVPAVGVYPAKFASYEVKAGDRGDFLVWHFDIDDGEPEPLDISATSSSKFTPMSKPYKWYCVLAETTPEVGAVIDLDSVIGASCQLVLSHKNVNGAIFPQIDEVVPVARQLRNRRRGRSAQPELGTFEAIGSTV